jgi:steroid delta-isomerase-like uncharacterized protein
MTPQPEAVIRAWFDEVWNQRQVDSIDRMFAADAVAYGLPGGTMQGPDGFRPLFNAFCGAFPDIHITVEQTVTEGAMVAARCRVTGTHTGEGLGVAVTGKAVDFQGIVLATIVDGQLRSGWNIFDFLTMYQQLGVIPPVPGT